MICEAVKIHFTSLREDSSHPKINVAFHTVTPLGIAILFYCSKTAALYKIEILTAVSIITGLLFSLIVFLIQLRHQMRIGVSQTAVTDRAKDNIDYAFTTAIYAIILGLCLVILLLLQQISASIWPGLTIGKRISNALISGWFTHFFLTIFLILKRLWRVNNNYGKNH